MPRMSREKRLEWSFFLNHRNRIAYNVLCRSCTHDCKQSFRAIVVLCPRYWSKRWKPPDGGPKQPPIHGKGLPCFSVPPVQRKGVSCFTTAPMYTEKPVQRSVNQWQITANITTSS